MKRIVAILVLSFFVPLGCELANALSTPAQHCKASQPEPSRDQKMACCFLVSLEAPAWEGPRRSESETVAAPPPAATVFMGPLVRSSSEGNPHKSPHIPPARLYVLHTSFLI